jgi:nucleotide-binding universal stress UspA family protein
MKRSVLVPLDGSAISERALDVAESLILAKKDTSLTLLRGLETPRLSAWLPAEMLPLYEQEKALVTDYLGKHADALEEKGLKVRTVLAPGPGPVEAVIAECSAGRADLVVMSSHGERGWIKSFLGSNTEKIARLAPTQILVVKGPEAPQLPFKRILIPLDGSDRAENALPVTLDVAPGGSARITLVGVSVVFQGHAFEGDLKTVVEPDFKRIQSYLDEQAEWLINCGYQVETLIRRGDPSEEILKVAETERSDLIVMTSQGRTGLARWFYGSVAERILRHSDCSVLVLKDLEKP